MIKPWLANKIIHLRNSRNYSIEELECRHKDSHSDHIDSIYFAGVDPSGISIVTRMIFKNEKSDGNWLKLYLPDEGVIGFENRSFRKSEHVRQGPMIYECKRPGQEWHIIYNGTICDDCSEEIEIDLRWKSDPFILDFSTEGVQYQTLSQQISSLILKKGFQAHIKGLGNVHYEQYGRIFGTIRYKGIKHDINLLGVRDHSYGRRNYDNWKKHLWFIGVLEDGRFFSMSSVDYRDIEDLNSGFIGDGRKSRVTMWKSPGITDLTSDGELPSKMKFTVVEKKNGPEINVRVVMKHHFPFVMDNCYQLRQSVAMFEYDKLRGRGIAELGIHSSLAHNSVPSEQMPAFSEH